MVYRTSKRKCPGSRSGAQECLGLLNHEQGQCDNSRVAEAERGRNLLYGKLLPHPDGRDIIFKECLFEKSMDNPNILLSVGIFPAILNKSSKIKTPSLRIPGGILIGRNLGLQSPIIFCLKAAGKGLLGGSVVRGICLWLR